MRSMNFKNVLTVSCLQTQESLFEIYRYVLVWDELRIIVFLSIDFWLQMSSLLIFRTSDKFYSSFIKVQNSIITLISSFIDPPEAVVIKDQFELHGYLFTCSKSKNESNYSSSGKCLKHIIVPQMCCINSQYVNVFHLYSGLKYNVDCIKKIE